ncbi:MAG TPA: glutathionylspermidine synthase family protein [Stellaceae bacterium]|nr:glutathionylspermidine synthase family protein [Stellaceae bacterium]
MRRETLVPRLDWPAKVEALGFDFHTSEDNTPYWWEAACYAFSADEIDRLEEASETLHALCLEAVDRIVATGDYQRLQIPDSYCDWVGQSWRRRDPDLYGRFDLAFDGRNPPKLLEYNADTPTALLEAAVVQWHWLEEVKPGCDQFNSVHEKLIAAWSDLRRQHPDTARLYLAGVLDELEDRRTLEYMRDVCAQGGWPTELLDIARIGWNGACFTDMAERPMTALFKLYPWEWLLRERFGANLRSDCAAFIEPPWKMLLSNKAILPVLWEMFPNHPNLLPASFSRYQIEGACIEKPIHGREGADIRPLRSGQAGSGRRGRVYQATFTLPVFDHMHAVIGSWIIAGKAAGIGMREDRSAVTTNLSRFVPHYFR